MKLSRAFCLRHDLPIAGPKKAVMPSRVPEGRGLRAALEAKDKRPRAIDCRRLHRVLAEGNFVLSVGEGHFDDVHSAFYDLFRLAGDRLAEHWDTREKVAPRSDWKNDNGKF